MDPISQAVVGVTAARSQKKNNYLLVILIAASAGMAPDLDVLINSEKNPLLSIEYHRHFTHSFFFIPFGALLIAAFYYLFLKNKFTFKRIYLISFLAYSTHGLLDACTSYGTLLFWPFSNERVAWNLISVVDPVFTFTLILFLALSFFLKKRIFYFLPIIWILLYFSLCLTQKNRALNALNDAINLRNHKATQILIKPSFGNILLWRTIYVHENKFYIDAVNTSKFSYFCNGTTLIKETPNEILQNFKKNSVLYEDVRKFIWFSSGYVYFDKKNNMISDIRYAFIPNSDKALWGIKFNANNYQKHVEWYSKNNMDNKVSDRFFSLILGENCTKI